MFSTLLKTLHSRQLLPRMSATESAALEAGDVWLDAEFFSGKPNFRRLLDETYPQLNPAERAFLEGPVEDVCRSVDPRDLERTCELPEETWTLLRQYRFFGLGLPERYSGHGFSALAQSTIFGKLATRSPSLSSVVLIPNSVGPGELLLEVGTDSQREYYLPRLARGDEIPCFALTEPHAGSDAASITSRGEVFERDGELLIRLDWEKRYITLAPIATLLGLAFRLYDPNGLLDRGDEDLGITCALVSTGLPGVEIGRRHDPMGLPFPNGPTRGRGVEIPIGQIIGGPDHAGRGWQMLMEALSGGRAVSLPAQATAGVKYLARVAGAYSRVRQQFGQPIGRFAGIEEPLARLAGSAYLLEASRAFTCGAIASGHRPAVISALMKYNQTESLRRACADAMDVLGGSAVCLGPRNLVSEVFRSAPIGITVEGANILTRTLIVFGQGAIRCHPYAHRLLDAAREHDVPAFRGALLRQIGHFLANFARTKIFGLTGGAHVVAPVSGPTARYYRKLAWASVRFAFYTDLALLGHGGKLKFLGKLSGRFADMLSWMYLASACLRRFEAEGRQDEDLPLVRWSIEHCLEQVQRAFEGILQNFEVPILGAWLRGPVSWLARLRPMGRPPSDALGQQVARTVQISDARRERLTSFIFQPADEPDHPLHVLENAFQRVLQTEPLERRLRKAVRRGQLKSVHEIREAVAQGILKQDEVDLLERANAARHAAIQVDSFSFAEYAQRHGILTAPDEPPSMAAIAG